MYTETLPSGRVRGGFRVAGKKYAKTFDYEFEAVAWATEAEARAQAAARGEDPPAAPAPAVPAAPAVPSSPTFGAYAKTWIKARRGHIVDSTAEGYERALKEIAKTEIDGVELAELKKEDVDDWISEQVENGVGRPTINARLKVLRMVLRYAVVNRVPGAIDVSEGIAFLTTDARPDRWLSWDEDARLLAAARTPEETAMILAGVDAGLRWEEAYALDVDCLDPFGNLVVRQVIERNARAIRRFPKSKKSRHVPTTDRLAAALAVLIAKAKAEGRDLLVSTMVKPKGAKKAVERPVDYWNWRRDSWRPICHAAKVNQRIAGEFKRLRFHDLRHTFGTRLAQAGVPSREIMELMGHSDEKQTARYTHAGNVARRGDLLRGALTPAATDGVASLDAARAARRTG